MSYKLVILVSALLLSLSATRITAISKLSGEPLIQVACHGNGDGEAECVSTLQSAPPDQKADANGLVFFALKFVENHAENITTGIKNMINEVPDVTPLLQSALSDCLEQYSSIDDLIEDAIEGVVAQTYSDAQQFMTTAIANIEVCDSELKDSRLEEEAEGKTGESVEMEMSLQKYNLLHRNLLTAALNILTAE